MANEADSDTLLVRNIGQIVSGDIEQGIVPGDAVLIRNHTIEAVGMEHDLAIPDDAVVVDAEGTVVMPGLVDSHVHLVLGDYTPRQQTVGFIQSYVHGGTTCFLSASEVHAPGRPSDPVGVKALAIAAQRCFSNFSPLGARLYGGSVILEPGLTEADFQELSQEGIWLAKAGFGAFARPRDVAPLVGWARKCGMKVMCHSGGASIPGSSAVSADDLIAMQPDVAGHINGGTTSLSQSEMERIVFESNMALQICEAGNLRAALEILNLATQARALERIILATDTPTGTGVMPLGMLRIITELTSLGQIRPEVAIAMATGNNARVYGLNNGQIASGCAADLVIMDAPLGSHAKTALEALTIGDLPGISMVVTRGAIVVERSRNTPPASRMAKVVTGGSVTASRSQRVPSLQT